MFGIFYFRDMSATIKRYRLCYRVCRYNGLGSNILYWSVRNTNRCNWLFNVHPARHSINTFTFRIRLQHIFCTVAYANLNVMISTSELSNVSFRLFIKRVLHAKLDTYVVIKRHRQLYCTYVLHMDRSILHITYFTVNARGNI